MKGRWLGLAAWLGITATACTSPPPPIAPAVSAPTVSTPAASTPAASPPVASTTEGVELGVTIEGLRNDRGTLKGALFATEVGFPRDQTKALRRKTVTISKGGTAELRWTGLPPGAYALSVFHDENGNGQLDQSFIGIPTEGIGASNNPQPRMGPPRFDEARFTLPTRGTTITVTMNYR